MGIYERQLLPRIINGACATKDIGKLRGRVCAGLAGDVTEIGFGSGLSVPFYPDAVTAVVAIEPADLAWKLAGKRLKASRIPITRSGLDGQSLPLPDNSSDAVVSIFTLCTIPDVAAALGEARRILRPGGTLRFAEHGLAPDERVRRWQHRLDPLQGLLFGGCHINRPIVDLITAAGFTIKDLDAFYLKGPKYGGAISLGTAVSS